MADKKITDLTELTSGNTADNDYLEIVDNDADESKKVQLDSLLAHSHDHVEADITDLDHTDADAFHDNVGGEFDALDDKATPVDADILVAEDSGDSSLAKVKMTVANLLATQHDHTESDISDLDHTDSDAIHDNVGGEINAITTKAVPINNDIILIEDSEDSSLAKKKITVGDIKSASGVTFPTTGNSVGDKFYRSDLGVEFVYSDEVSTGVWKAIRGDEALSLYLDGDDGTDDIEYGFASGTDAVATWDYLHDYLITSNFAGDISIYISNYDFSSIDMYIKGKYPIGNAEIYIYGTLSEVIASTALDSAVQGTGSTQGSITKTGAFSLDATSTIVGPDSDGGVTAGDNILQVDNIDGDNSQDTGFTDGGRVVIDPEGVGNGPEVKTVESIASNGDITVSGEFENDHATGTTVIQCTYAKKLAYSSSDGVYRVVDWNTEDKIVISGTWPAEPSGNVAIYEHGTTFQNVDIKVNQKSINIYDIKFTGKFSLLYEFSSFKAYRCYFVGTTWKSVYSLNGLTKATFYQCVIEAVAAYCSSVTNADRWEFQGCIIDGDSLANICVSTETGCVVSFTYGTIVEGGVTYGITVNGGCNASFYNAAAWGYPRIRDCGTGLYKSSNGNVAYNNLIQYSGCTTDETLIA